MSHRFHHCRAEPLCGWCRAYEHDPAFRADWDARGAARHAAEIAVGPIILSPPPPRPVAAWPWLARVLARLRTPEDCGLGDTVARHLDRFGGDAWKRVYEKLMGRRCPCADRQAALNAAFPYPDSLPGPPSG